LLLVTRLEGADRFGNLFESLAEFVLRNKVLIVHLRNVTAPLPTFTETFMDGGYGNMYMILRTLVRAGLSLLPFFFNFFLFLISSLFLIKKKPIEIKLQATKGQSF
jgi:hypothetical protein